MRNLTLKTLTLAMLVITPALAQTKNVSVMLYQYDDTFIGLMKDSLTEISHQHPTLNFRFNDSQNSQFVQNNQVDKALELKAKVLAVNLVDPNAWRTVVGKAMEWNVPVIFFNKDPSNRALESYDNAYYIGTDPVEMGKLQAAMIAKQWKANPQYDLNKDGKIQYAVLKGEIGHPDAENRTRTVIDELATLVPNSEMLAMESAQWKSNLAKEKVAAWLSAPSQNKIEVIVANNDAMAIGASEATTEQGQNIPIYGVDGIPVALNMIKVGALAGTIQNDWVSQSQAIVDFASNLAQGRKAEQGTKWQLKGRILRVPYKMIEKADIK